MQNKRVLIVTVMLFLLTAGLTAAEKYKPHELGLAFNSYYNLQYSDIQNINLNPGFYYTHYVTEDTGFGIQFIPLSFAFISEKEEIKADNRLFREKMKLNSSTFAIYLQKKHRGFLGTDRQTVVRTGLTYLSASDIDLLTDENKILLDDYYSEKPEYSTSLQNYSAAATLLSGYGLFAEASTAIYQNNNFSINAGLSMALLQFTYEYKLRGRIYNDTTSQYEYLDRDETTVVQQGLFTVSLIGSYQFAVNDLSKIFGTTKIPAKKESLPATTVSNLDSSALSVASNPIDIKINSFLLKAGDKLRVVAAVKDGIDQKIAGGFISFAGETISFLPIDGGRYKAVKVLEDINALGKEEQIKVTVLLADGKTVNSTHRVFIDQQDLQYQIEKAQQTDHQVTEDARAEDFGLEELL